MYVAAVIFRAFCGPLSQSNVLQLLDPQPTFLTCPCPVATRQTFPYPGYAFSKRKAKKCVAQPIVTEIIFSAFLGPSSTVVFLTWLLLSVHLNRNRNSSTSWARRKMRKRRTLRVEKTGIAPRNSWNKWICAMWRLACNFVCFRSRTYTLQLSCSVWHNHRWEDRGNMWRDGFD